MSDFVKKRSIAGVVAKDVRYLAKRKLSSMVAIIRGMNVDEIRLHKAGVRP